MSQPNLSLVRSRFQPWQLAALLVLICIVAIGIVYFARQRRGATPAELVTFLPRSDASVLYVDVHALRQSGLLGLIVGSKVTGDLEYKEFIDQTHFDYGRDLDALAASFQGEQVYFVLRGRFDWKSLIGFAMKHGGKCLNSFCSVASSKPNRLISFFPLQSNLMGLALSPDPSAAYELAPRRRNKLNMEVPNQPVWISFPPAALRNPASFPPGTRSFATVLSMADRVVFSLTPNKDKIEVHLEVRCQSPAIGALLRKELDKTTATLRAMFEREHKTPNPSDLSGVLTAGTFRQEDRIVYGVWPVPKSFVEAVAGGSID